MGLASCEGAVKEKGNPHPGKPPNQQKDQASGRELQDTEKSSAAGLRTKKQSEREREKWWEEGVEGREEDESNRERNTLICLLFFPPRSTCFSIKMGTNTLEWRSGDTNIFSSQQRRRRSLHNPCTNGRLL